MLPSSEVEDLLARLRASASKVGDAAGTLELDAVARLAGLAYGEVVARVLDGRLGGSCWLGLRSGLAALRVREASAHWLPTSEAGEPVVPS